MSILVLSVSHKTAPVELLSRASMDAVTSARLEETLAESEHIDEAVVLSTCNRTEIYANVSRFHHSLEDITGRIADATGLAPATLQQHCAVFYDEAAVSHLFNVTSGLDSMVVGENQILGQVKSALTRAQDNGAVGPHLNTLFQQGLRVGKRVQSDTEVGAAGQSLMTAALDELYQQGIQLAGQRVVIVGAGSMAALSAHTLAGEGVDLTLVNRTYDKAEHLARAVGGRPRPMSELEDALAEADILVTCTGARGTVITSEHVRDAALSAVIDLAMPADVDKEAARYAPLINIALLMERDTDHSTASQLRDAQRLVGEETKDYLARRRAAQVKPTVVALRSMARDVVDAELQRLEGLTPGLSEADRFEVEKAVHRVVDKLLHQPTVRVQQYARSEQEVDYAAALRDLFALDPDHLRAVTTTTADGTPPVGVPNPAAPQVVTAADTVASVLGPELA
ncbi:glutamyl-tRNA reductase [Raineyella antarctica]|uniref:Glutamyl-tRNA reductase n=1 Tax=Raineyella antarctica TaxID=1577474 RepID=A0A1G6GGD2_9ACTN|nr:glutamyl-tRNA reductase [Raineyella antarctica]SDB80236.1 glutamyl-tRNA reductase [Raineyella antarctica]